MDEMHRFRAWRTAQSKSLKDVADSLGVNITTVARWETGAMLPDADMVERIARLTGGEVSAADMHAVRLAWLKANRPEKFEAASESALPSPCPAAPAAKPNGSSPCLLNPEAAE